PERQISLRKYFSMEVAWTHVFQIIQRLFFLQSNRHVFLYTRRHTVIIRKISRILSAFVIL
ncbi:MAG: hypothetical protein OQK59_00355, partial [Chlorobium sp.]|nr:hypothetical protein [Chlorobium sp.]